MQYNYVDILTKNINTFYRNIKLPKNIKLDSSDNYTRFIVNHTFSKKLSRLFKGRTLVNTIRLIDFTTLNDYEHNTIYFSVVNHISNTDEFIEFDNSITNFYHNFLIKTVDNIDHDTTQCLKHI